MRYRFGLIGNKISYSLSPRIHHQIMKICELNGTYELLDMEEFPGKETLLEFCGLNVTTPFKEIACDHADSLHFSASRVGAVNTLSIDSQIIGYNTDYLATRFLLEARANHGDSAIVFGTGGAARASIAALKDLGFYNISIRGRESYKVNMLMDFFKIKSNSNGLPSKDYDIAVNAVSPSGFTFLEKSLADMTFRYYVDFIYHRESPLLKKAISHGISGISGIEILLLQAVLSQEIWTGSNLSRLYDLEAVRNVL